jgi:hypothetical protein
MIALLRSFPLLPPSNRATSAAFSAPTWAGPEAEELVGNGLEKISGAAEVL